MFYYDVVEESHSDSDIGAYSSFGVIAYLISDGVKEKLCHIDDVFPNKSKAADFVRRCNDFQLSPVHIYDAILDAIG